MEKDAENPKPLTALIPMTERETVLLDALVVQAKSTELDEVHLRLQTAITGFKRVRSGEIQFGAPPGPEVK